MFSFSCYFKHCSAEHPLRVVRVCTCACVCARVCSCICVLMHVCMCVCKYFSRTDSESCKHGCEVKGRVRWGLAEGRSGLPTGQGEEGRSGLLEAEEDEDAPRRKAGLLGKWNQKYSDRQAQASRHLPTRALRCRGRTRRPRGADPGR